MIKATVLAACATLSLGTISRAAEGPTTCAQIDDEFDFVATAILQPHPGFTDEFIARLSPEGLEHALNVMATKDEMQVVTNLVMRAALFGCGIDRLNLH